MAPLLTAFALLLGLTGSLLFLNRRFGSGQTPSTPHDRGSSALLGMTHMTSMIAGGLFPALHLAADRWSLPLAWVGVVLMPLGFALQGWSMRTLGRHFTFTLAATEAQPLVSVGPYRLVRHPGYLGQIVCWLGFGLATRNALSLAVIASAVAIGYGYRIHREERMLRSQLGEAWSSYAKRRARLIPGVW